MGLILAAGAWGFAEATVFFLVPDVLITWLAVRRLRDGLWGSLAATVGALCGGLLMYAWGSHDSQGALTALDHVPAINAEMLAELNRVRKNDGPFPRRISVRHLEMDGAARSTEPCRAR